MSRIKLEGPDYKKTEQRLVEGISSKIKQMVIGGSKIKGTDNVTAELLFSTDPAQKGHLQIHFDTDDHHDSAKNLVTALNKFLKPKITDVPASGDLPKDIFLDKTQTDQFLAQKNLPPAPAMSDLTNSHVPGTTTMDYLEAKAIAQEKNNNTERDQKAFNLLKGIIPKSHTYTNMTLEGDTLRVKNTRLGVGVAAETFEQLQILQKEGYLKELTGKANDNEITLKVGDRPLTHLSDRINKLPDTVKTLSATTEFSDYRTPLALGIGGGLTCAGGIAVTTLGALGTIPTAGTSSPFLGVGWGLIASGGASVVAAMAAVKGTTDYIYSPERKAYQEKEDYQKVFDGKNIDSLHILEDIKKLMTPKEASEIGNPRIVLDDTQTLLKFQFNEENSPQAKALAEILNQTMAEKGLLPVIEKGHGNPSPATTLILDGKQTKAFIEAYKLTAPNGLDEHLTQQQSKLLQGLVFSGLCGPGTSITDTSTPGVPKQFTASNNIPGVGLTTTFERLNELQKQGYIKNLDPQGYNSNSQTFELDKALTQQAIDHVTTHIGISTGFTRDSHMSAQGRSTLATTADNAKKTTALEAQLAAKVAGEAELAALKVDADQTLGSVKKTAPAATPSGIEAEQRAKRIKGIGPS